MKKFVPPVEMTERRFQSYRDFSKLLQEEKTDVLKRLNDHEATLLRYTWEAWARDRQLEQMEAPGDWWTHWVILAGRGFGKTRIGAEWIRKQAESNKVGRMILVARTAADVRDTMVEGESGLLSISPPWFYPEYQPSKRRVVWPNGAMAITFSAEEPDSLRGPQCLIGSTQVLMSDGSQKQLADIQTNDLVMTRMGPRRVIQKWLTKRNTEVYILRTMDRRTITGTAEHPIWVPGQGFVPLCLLSKGMSVCVINVLNGTDISGINVPVKTTMNDVSSSIEPSGKMLMNQSQMDVISTTRMAIRQIIGLKTLKCLPVGNIVHDTMLRSYYPGKNLLTQDHVKHWNVRDKTSLNVTLPVPIVEKYITVGQHIRQVIAHQPVLKLSGHVLLKEKCVNASIAQKHTLPQKGYNNIVLGSVITGQVEHVPKPSQSEISSVISVDYPSNQEEQMHAFANMNLPWLSMMRIESVEKLAELHDVYDITVEDAHEFFAQGILVHNSEKAWADERASWCDEAWDNLMFGLRLGKKPQCIVTTTPRPTKAIIELKKAKTSKVTIGSTYENRENLAPSFLEQIVRKYEGTRLGRQELYAEIIDDAPGALWKREAMIEAYRVTHHPELKRIVVSLDPPAGSGEDDDLSEAGIIVAGVGIDDHGYVLADCSMRGSPNEWARAVIVAYNLWHADRVVGEVNNGGDMVEAVIRNVAREDNLYVSYKSVRATRGKQLRAEPISSLYEQGRCHHVGTFPDMEDQMCNWEPGMKSPDRLDALVWAFTDLLIGESYDGIPQLLYAPDESQLLYEQWGGIR